MTKKNILVFGAGGQIGHALGRASIPNDWNLTLAPRHEVDMGDRTAIHRKLYATKPDLVINLAHYSGADLERSEDIHFHGVAFLAAQCAVLDVPVIHLSTCDVFDGNHNVPYLPDDAMNPINQYALHRMMGEEALRHEHAWNIILRTTQVFSAHGHNIVTNLRNQILNDTSIKAAQDLWIAPTPASDIADTIIKMGAGIFHGMHNGFGTFHFCSSPAISHYDFALEIMRLIAPPYPPEIIAVSASAIPDLSEKPLYSILDCNKIKDVYDSVQGDWHDALAKTIDDLSGQ